MKALGEKEFFKQVAHWFFARDGIINGNFGKSFDFEGCLLGMYDNEKEIKLITKEYKSQTVLVSEWAVFITGLTKIVHEANLKWWTNIRTGEKIERNVGEMLCLVHSEISEALEGHRKNLKDDKTSS